MVDPLEREITPPEMYFNRRTLLRAGLAAAFPVWWFQF